MGNYIMAYDNSEDRERDVNPPEPKEHYEPDVDAQHDEWWLRQQEEKESKIIHGFISENGILLDDDYNELRDEEGGAIHIPEKDWKHYKIITERWT
jgi:phage pi2 protein 07